MADSSRDFYGKDVAEAIRNACNEFGVAQEHLTIEVLDTGSKGIFGLIRQRAHIRARVQGPEEERQPEAAEGATGPVPEPSDRGPEKRTARRDSGRERAPTPTPPAEIETPRDSLVDEADDDEEDEEVEEDPQAGPRQAPEVPAETLAVVREELTSILELMGCPSPVEVDSEDGGAHCRIGAEHQHVLAGDEGKVLDSLQYLLRKIVSKKVSGHVQITLDVGNFREQRYQELRQRALEYGALVKEDGKTQVILALNPSERRVVHVALQDDPEIRSRSVGDGLFKKVLIYRPGKGRKAGSARKRGRPRSRRKGENGPKTETS